MLKWNNEYQVYVSDDGRIISKTRGICKLELINNGYLRWSTFDKDRRRLRVLVHRLVWETFRGPIPVGYEIDHKNRIRTDNSLDNLQCVTHVENMQNWEVPERHPRTEFGRKFKEHFGIKMSEDRKLYLKEYSFYKKYKKCSWE
jgi:hypothetical protein